jgi:ABC-type glycerol-3-phosphate transport system substrate-binding protein
MARLTLLFSAALLALAACGGASDVAGTEDAAVKAQAADAIDPKLAAEMEKLKKIQA